MNVLTNKLKDKSNSIKFLQTISKPDLFVSSISPNVEIAFCDKTMLGILVLSLFY